LRTRRPMPTAPTLPMAKAPLWELSKTKMKKPTKIKRKKVTSRRTKRQLSKHLRLINKSKNRRIRRILRILRIRRSRQASHRGKPSKNRITPSPKLKLALKVLKTTLNNNRRMTRLTRNDLEN